MDFWEGARHVLGVLYLSKPSAEYSSLLAVSPVGFIQAFVPTPTGKPVGRLGETATGEVDFKLVQ